MFGLFDLFDDAFEGAEPNYPPPEDRIAARDSEENDPMTPLGERSFRDAPRRDGGDRR